MYAGELVFILIAVMFGSGLLLACSGLGVALQWAWAVFHILIITLLSVHLHDADHRLPVDGARR